MPTFPFRVIRTGRIAVAFVVLALVVAAWSPAASAADDDATKVAPAIAPQATSADTPKAGPAESPPDPSPERWAKQVAAYDAADAAHPPAEGGVVFAGSSTIRMWKDLAKAFAPMPVIGRGIGGSHISDQIYWAKRLVLGYRPSQVVFYAGDNDVAAGKKAGRVLADFRRFVALVHKDLPKAWVHFLAIKPSVKREALWPEMAKANRLIAEFAETEPHVTFIDVAAPMLDAAGRPRPDLFIADGLHMNAKGYALWTPLVKAALAKATRSESGGETSAKPPGAAADEASEAADGITFENDRMRAVLGPDARPEFVRVQPVTNGGGEADLRACVGDTKGGAVATLWHAVGKTGTLTIPADAGRTRAVDVFGKPIALASKETGTVAIRFGHRRVTVLFEGLDAAAVRQRLLNAKAR